MPHLQIVEVRPEEGVLYISAGLPGARHSLILLSGAGELTLANNQPVVEPVAEEVKVVDEAPVVEATVEETPTAETPEVVEVKAEAVAEEVAVEKEEEVKQ